MTTLFQLISEQSNKYPDKVAIKHNSKIFTYSEIEKISSQLALYLKDRGVIVGDRVALVVERSPEMVIFLLAIIKSGATYLPIDSNFPIERIKYMTDDSSAKVLITTRKIEKKFTAYSNLIFVEDAFRDCTSLEPDSLITQLSTDSIAYILYTSGSTGKPKGVEVKHSGLVNLLLSIQQRPGIDIDDVVLLTTTISFDIAELEVYLPLISGATLVIADAEIVKDGRALLNIAKSENVSIMQGTPFMWRMMLEAGWNESLPMKIFCGGEAMTKELAKNLVPKCASLWNMYGPTETTIYSLIKHVSDDDEVITIGNPILNTQVYILDEDLNEVSPGQVGEIFIGGDGVAKGYINRQDLTDERFIDDRFIPAEGKKIYKTGDLGRVLKNGEIQCLGRIDHQIKIRGYRIETEEVEFQLKQQPNIKEAIVTVFEDKLNNMHLVAYVVTDGLLDTINRDQIKLWKSLISEVLPEYMVPSHYVAIPAIPLMPNGKVDRNSLPNPLSAQTQVSYEAPQTDNEILLANIFLKNIAIERIGATDNFFDLGIDSLIAVKIMLEIEKKFGKRLPLTTLITFPTIRQLADVIEHDTVHSAYKSLVPIKPGGSKLPIYIVHGIGLNVYNLYGVSSLLDSEQPVYGMQAVGLDGSVEPLDNIIEIASFYNREIMEHDPVGPYIIAGYSFGGYIAYEMVKQLKGLGKEVRMLGMFDTNLQIQAQGFPLLKRIFIKLARQFHKLNFRIGTLIREPLLTFKYLRSYYLITVKLFLKKFGFFANYDPNSLPDFMQVIAGKLNFAFSNYVFEPYHVKIDLFMANTRLYFVDDGKFLGWKDHALDGIIVHKIPGDHEKIFQSPNDAILAKILQDRLDQINDK